jgi:hypothetical protein
MCARRARTSAANATVGDTGRAVVGVAVDDVGRVPLALVRAVVELEL